MAAGFSKLPRLPIQANWPFQLSVMDRYITMELITPFLFGVGAFSSLGVSAGALFELIRRVTESGLPLAIAFKVLLLRFPQFIVYSFPTAMLMANLMTYSRLSSDSELTALKACGVSVYRMVVPALVLCTLVTGLTFLFNESIVPSANFQATVTLSEALESDEPLFQERNILYQEFRNVEDKDGDREEVLSRLFYAKEFNGQEMLGLTILDFSQEGLDQIVSARSAAWNSDQKTWDFSDGTIYVVSADGNFRNIVKFQQQQLQLPRAPLDLASRKRDYDEMNIAESLDYLETLKQSGSESKIQKLRVRIQQKLALPFVCISFGLVGAVLGTRLSGAFAQLGYISPILGGWLPNIFGLVVTGWLLVKSSQ
jgi:lipopolysaccharide export system permease protein